MDHDKQFYIGAAYYPELWDNTVTDLDIERCKSLGLNALRMGEFAWGKMQPREGEFDLGWLLDAVEKLYRNGIYTVMCTPTATPPRWLLNKYPETRMVMHDLIRADVSSRCHTCKTSEILREKNREIVGKMGEVLGSHPGIVGWQLDNEIYPYSEGCYCENCKNLFRNYLAEKYRDIQTLNQAWGMSRWSLCYDGFGDIQPPYPRQWRHPSLRKAWRDFHGKQIETYLAEQKEVLRGYTSAPVGTNMMQHNSLSYCKINQSLDVVQYNHYESVKRLPHTAFGYDFVRTVKDKPFWVMETQAGWNGSEYAEGGYRAAGACYVNTWLPIARGGEMNLFWLFRAHPNGHEIGHGGLFSSAGRECRVSDEVRRASAEIKECGFFLANSSVKSKIALHYSSTAYQNFECAPILKGFRYRETLIDKFYAAFRHYNVDVIDTPHGLDGYEIILSPFLTTLGENGFKERIAAWVLSGGTWIVGPMSDCMDENVCRYTEAPYPFLEEFGGVFTKYQIPVDNDVFKAKWANGDGCGVSMCFDAFELKQGTRSLARYTDGELAPLSVVTERNVGKGRVIFLGSVVSCADLLRLVNRKPILRASDNIVLTRRTGGENGVVAIEAENKAGYLILDGVYTDLISKRKLSGRVELAPYDVLVLKKDLSPSVP